MDSACAEWTMVQRLFRYLGSPFTFESGDIFGWRVYRLIDSSGEVVLLSRDIGEIQVFIRGFNLGRDDAGAERHI